MLHSDLKPLNLCSISSSAESRPSTSPRAKSLPSNDARSASIAVSPICPAADTSVGPISATIPGTVPMSVPKISAARGTTCEAAVSTLVTRLSVSCDMSASESPRPVSQFSHAAFAMLSEPSMVVAASRAVVPATAASAE